MLCIPTTAAAAGEDIGVEIKIHTNKGEVLHNFYPFGKEYRGEVEFSAADVMRDSKEEIIAAAGPGLKPEVKVFTESGELLSSFLAYSESYLSGVRVTSCDLNNDGSPEIITGTYPGGGPHVRIFSAEGDALYGGGFFAYAGDFRGGVHVTCADVDGDGMEDIITSPGVTGGPHIKVFSPDATLKHEFFAADRFFTDGLTVRAENIDADASIELITASASGSNDTVRTFEYNPVTKSFVRQSEFRSGIASTDGYRLGISDTEGDGILDLTIAAKRADSPLVYLFGWTGEKKGSFTLFDSKNHGVITDQIDLGPGKHQVSISSSDMIRNALGQYIVVDVSEQRLYAYENGTLQNTFLISTGRPQYETPRGEFSVTDKLPVHDYRWSFGENDPRNYDLPGVRWNLRFKRYFYIHSAPWHNNFGQKMSHGCVNVHPSNAEWIYNWANEGAKVEIVD